MMSKIKNPAQLIVVCVIFLISAGMANAEGVYLGVDIGQSDYEGETATSFRLIAGVPINENFNVEGAWINQGEASESGFEPGFGFFEADIELSGIQVFMVGKTSLQDNVSLFGKVGLYLWDIDASFTDFSGTFSGSEDGSDLVFGFGLDVGVNEQVNFRGGYELISVDFAGVDIDADMLFVGLTYKIN